MAFFIHVRIRQVCIDTTRFRVLVHCIVVNISVHIIFVLANNVPKIITIVYNSTFTIISVLTFPIDDTVHISRGTFTFI